MINAFEMCITVRVISTVFEISTEKDILISPSCPNDVPSCSEKRFSWSFRNQLRLKDGNPDCRNNSWKTAWETNEYKRTQLLSNCCSFKSHSLVFVVHLLFWQWGFRVLFQVISDPVERVHLLSPAGWHGILVATGKTEEKEGFETWCCSSRKLCVQLLLLYNISRYKILQFFSLWYS